MAASATIIELEPLALSPAEAVRYPSVLECSLSRLISEGKIEARKHDPWTLVDVASLIAISPACGRRLTTRRLCSAAALTCCRVPLRNRGTDASMRGIRT
jgi:hypothetical protein